MKKKEILIIFVLAVLITGGSWFYKKKPYPLPTNTFITLRGLPLHFWCKSCNFFACNVSYSYNYLVLDLLFWFLVIFAIWQMIKWVKGRYGKRS